MHLLQHAMPHFVAATRNHNLLDVQVFERERIQVGIDPTLPGNFQFTLPLAMTPYYRRLRIHTESADPSSASKALAGFLRCFDISGYRRWGIAPRPENCAA